MVLRKLLHFQRAGHQIVLLFGGFTATIGDPTGKDESRPPLTFEQVEENAKDYLRQAGKILDMDKVEVVNNKDWLQKLTPRDFLELMGQFTVPQMMERDMFQERLKQGKTVHCHEIVYPVLVGYDSVALKADVEIGGTDQLFNLLAARPLQQHYDQVPQNILTVPLIEGTDGVQKMSKSLGNYVSLSDPAEEMFGKIMSIPDTLMFKYFETLTDIDLAEAQAMINDHPRNAKVFLAKDIITFFHDQASADDAEAKFIQKFVKKEVPDEMPEFIVSGEVGILDLMSKVTGFAASNGEARRLIKGGGVSLNGEKVSDPNLVVTVTEAIVLKVGKRKFGRIVSS